MPKPYEFWINPERQGDDNFYQAFRQYQPGRHFIPVREIDLTHEHDDVTVHTEHQSEKAKNCIFKCSCGAYVRPIFEQLK